jgi:aminopeptidase N
VASAKGISYDQQTERVTVTFPEAISLKEAVLELHFKGTINNAMAGFSRSQYKSTAEHHPDTPKFDGFHYMFSTQFEACDARRVFPCFDEPNLKASFDFEIEVPKGLVVLSNMPVKSELEGSKPSLKVVSFDRTPVMSTYVRCLNLIV